MTKDSRDNRFFDGDAGELQKIKSKESLQRFERAQRMRAGSAKLFRAFIFLILCIIFALLCINVFFVVRKVEVIGCERYTGEELLALADIEPGDSLYSIDRKTFDKLPARLSNIREASFRRVLPGTLVITLIEDQPKYFTELYGEYFVLSDELRVLDRLYYRDHAMMLEIPELILPPLDLALVGSKLVFEQESSERYVLAYLEVLSQSPVSEQMDAFDLSDRFSLRMICGGYKYLCELAGGSDLSTKLSTLYQILMHPALEGKGAARIDVTDPTQGRAIFDITEVSFDS